MAAVRLGLVLTLITFCSLLNAQTETPAVPQRDSRAIQLITSAVDALGGATQIGQLVDARAMGTYSPTEDSWLPAADFRWENAGNKFRYETNAPDGTRLFVSNRNRPVAIDGTVTTKFFAHTADSDFPAYLVARLLLQKLRNQDFELSTVDSPVVDGKQLLHFRTRLTTDKIEAELTRQDWYFDPSSGLPVRVDYQVPTQYDAGRFLKTRVDLSDYRSVSGIQVPFKISIYINDKLGGTAVLSNVQINLSLPDSEFDAPVGAN